MFEGTTTSNGMPFSEAKKIVPELTENEADYGEHGWYFKDYRETPKEAYMRARKAIDTFKQMAKESEDKDASIFVVSHGIFITYIVANLLGQ